MKIVHILPPLTKGGAERVVVNLANEAAAAGDEVTIVAAYPVDPELLLYAVDRGVEVRYAAAGPTSRLGPYLALLPWVVRNRHWLLQQDVVHCHLTFGAVAGTAIQMLRDLRGGGRPKVVETFHAVGMPLAMSKRLLSTVLARGRDGFVLMASDEHWARFRSKHPRLPMEVIPNGIAALPPAPTDAERLAYRRAAGIPDGCRQVVGTVGRLVPERMPEAFLPIFAAIAREAAPDVHFLMAGDGALVESTGALAERQGLAGRLHLPGLVRRPELAFANIDVYLSINVGPITGIAALEAAAFGLPVISIQSLPEHEPGPDDWIWSSTDPEAVAAESLRLLRSAAERAELSARQKAQVAARYTAEAMAAAYRRFYERLLAR